MHSDDIIQLLHLLRDRRWAALATVQEDGTPYCSHVAYATEPDGAGVLLHLSRLAAHTGLLLARPQAALAITTPDSGEGDPQSLARLTLQGTVRTIERDDPQYAAAQACYLARLPSAERLFAFGDFVLLRLSIDTARYVGGFARAHNVSGERLRQCVREAEGLR